jgi:4-aminobutyrate aminotransferase-like enzyme
LVVRRAEGLPAHVTRVRALFGALRHRWRDRPDWGGDGRGSGLFWGVELVKDRQSLSPASREAARVAEAMKNVGVLIGTDGPYHNVLKIRPPMQFDENNAAYLCEALNEVIANP